MEIFCSRRKVERENKKKALAKQIMEQVQAIKGLETTPNSKLFSFLYQINVLDELSNQIQDLKAFRVTKMKLLPG